MFGVANEILADPDSDGDIANQIDNVASDLTPLIKEAETMEEALHLADEANIRCLGPEVIVAGVRVGVVWPPEAQRAVNLWRDNYEERCYGLLPTEDNATGEDDA
jgi:hypothetical protein